MKTKINLVMIVKNEQEKLERCLKSVKDIVNEIIIIDTGSIDKTKHIASKYNALIYDYMWDNDFSNARNFGLEKSDSDWNLILDADEYIVDIDYNKLNLFLKQKEKRIGTIKILNLFEKNNETMTSQSFVSRLAPQGIFFKGKIHEQLKSNYDREYCGITIEHDGYLDKSKKIDRNISLLLEELKYKSDDSYILYQIAKTYYVASDFENASIYFKDFYKVKDYDRDNFLRDGVISYLYTIIKTKEFEEGLKIINENFDIFCEYPDFYFVCGVFFTEIVAYDLQKYSCYFENIELCYLNAIRLGESEECDVVRGTGSYLAYFNLGIYYELLGAKDTALKYYKESAKLGYKPAILKVKKTDASFS